jgi:hypothetical protein
MATTRQIEANRSNARLSSGPRTEEGKTGSRGNAFKHGLAGDGVVLPDDETAKVNERIAAWAAVIQPASPIDSYFVAQFATESVRVELCQREERILLLRRAAWAESGWDEDRRLAAEELGARLGKDPALVVRRLRQTSQGCDWLLQRWQGLNLSLEAGRSWDDDQRRLALDLLGFPAEFRGGPTPADPGPDEGPAACIPQLAMVTEQMFELRRLKAEVMDDRDDVERDGATRGILPGDAQTERELALTRRYERACQRRLDEARRLLFSGRLHEHSALKPHPDSIPAPDPASGPEPVSPPSVAASPLPEAPSAPEPSPAPCPARLEAEPERLDVPTVPEPASDEPKGNRRWRKAQSRLARQHVH